MHPLETYLRRLQEIRDSEVGTPELSYRGALENLLNAVGTTIEPPVQVTGELADTGAGRPDFGVVEANSYALRAVVETKPVEHSTPDTARGDQVSEYWKQYGYVLVTNYRDFLLVVKQPDGTARIEAHYQLAPSAKSFWQARPKALTKEHAEPFTDFLIGVLTRAAPIGRPRDLAADLARHAREAKRRLAQHDISAVAPLQLAMEQALGLHFTGEEGLDFFRSSLVQTLFYGLFSGWMLWRQSKHKPGTFDWKDASEHLALPLIGDLYEEIARPKRLGELGLREPLDWATTSLGRVDEEEFFRQFDADHAITLFYEPFLEAFDPNLRKELGVWYTPPEIVRYQVGRVDELLRSELGIADGLADENVYVLDPACGTGSYLLEVARVMQQTWTDQGFGAIVAARVRKALCSRVFGFEILPAPYVVAHLQLGVLVRSWGLGLTKDERFEVYLTNALTGWEPAKEPKTALLFPELQKEAERARRVKREAPILVILGNPPYNAFAGVAEDEEADLIEPYKERLHERWGVRKQLLDDLYIRFFRLAEKRIGEIGGRGIVSYISNYSWLDGLSHPVMRERIAIHFDKIWIDNCNGDKYKTGKRTPDGRSDQSMFTTDEHPIGIQVGTAIATMVKQLPTNPSTTGQQPVATVYYRDFWGTGNEKRKLLLTALLEPSQAVPDYVTVLPRETMRWVFANGALGQPTTYETWPKIEALFAEVYKGVQPGRNGALVSIDKGPLLDQMRDYYDPKVDDEGLRSAFPELMHNESGYNATAVRRKLLKKKIRFREENLVRICWMPFDIRFMWWESEDKLLHRRREEFQQQVRKENLFLACTQKPRKGKVSPPLVSGLLGSYYVFDPYTTYFPLRVHHNGLHQNGLEPGCHPAALEAICRAYDVHAYESGSSTWSKRASQIAEDLFFHIVALLWSPAYRTENEAALRQDWPRVPIPAVPKVLEASAQLGRIVTKLLQSDTPVPGVTTGRLRPELRSLGIPSKVGGGQPNPATDLVVDAGWGFRGQKNAVMCGKGRVLPSADDPQGAVDVYLNDKVCWARVPKDVWTMTIGGYPVLKKWLSYREHKVLGRPLTLDEVTYITEVVRRLQALLLLGPELDANYRTVSVQTLTLEMKE